MEAVDLFEGLDTARLRLRCLHPGDASSIAALMTPAVSATLASWPAPMDEHTALKRIEDARTDATAGKLLPFAILLRETSAFIGYVGLALVEPEPPRRAKLGYWIGEPYQGRGYAREAALAAVAASYPLLATDEVEAAVEVDNVASEAILRACGLAMIEQRMMPARGGEHLCNIYRAYRQTL